MGDSREEPFPAQDHGWIKTEVGAALAHANMQVENLFREMREWSASHPVTMRPLLDKRGRSVTFVLDRIDEAPLWSWTQQCGDALHNWRRMLDSLAWDLSQRFVVRPLSSRQRDSVKFPLIKSRTEFDRLTADSRSWLSALNPEHARRLGLTQPYIADDPNHSILRWLQDLDNTRKHRGGLQLRQVLDHSEGFLFVKVEDAVGNNLAVPESSMFKLSDSRSVFPGLPVLKLNYRGIERAEATEPVPVTYVISHGDDESDLERLLLSLSEQLVATLTVVYTGHFPPPMHRVDPKHPLANRVNSDGRIGEWAVTGRGPGAET